MKVWGGWVFTREGFVEGWLNPLTKELGFGQAVDPIKRGVIFPAFRNCHTHLGDTGAREEVPDDLSLEEIVGVDGWKHTWLSNQKGGESLERGIREAEKFGTGLIIDFREGGVEGLSLLNEINTPIQILGLGRPGHENEEAPSENIGLSSYVDVGEGIVEGLVSKAKNSRGVVALHHSEKEWEDIAPVLKINPDFLVHLCEASDEDLIRIKEEGIGVVVCPRSNSRFGMRAPLERMLGLKIDVGLGTDNGMFCSLNMLEELRFISREFPSIPALELIRLLCFGLEETIGKFSEIKIENKQYVIMKEIGENPEMAVLDSKSEILEVIW